MTWQAQDAQLELFGVYASVACLGAAGGAAGVGRSGTLPPGR